jgi:hypothetical protein
VNLSAPGSLAVAGALEITGDGRLRLDGSNPPRELTLNGATVVGTGTVRFEGANFLRIATPTVLNGINWVFTSASGVAGTSLLTIGTNAVVSFDHSVTYNGAITVAGQLQNTSSSSLLAIGGVLMLESTGTILNNGTITATAFVNNGGTIVGNPPVAAAPLAISLVKGASEAKAIGSAPAEVVLRWRGPVGHAFQVQSSGDLRSWTAVSTTVREVIPGHYEARISFSPSAARHFYRVVLGQAVE